MQADDYGDLSKLCARVYPDDAPYTAQELEEHHQRFPDGQYVAEHVSSGVTVGAHFTLILRLADFHLDDPWDVFTARGTFADHNPESGHTLYCADIMVCPEHQHHGLAAALTDATRELVFRKNLWRMVAASRLPGYGRFQHEMSVDEYVRQVSAGLLTDPVLTVHLKDGWQLVRPISGYLPHDVESANEAAIIQWLNPKSPTPVDFLLR